MSRVPVGAAPACDGKPIGPADFGVERFSVAAVLDRRAEQFPDRVMMSIDGIDVTFEQMRQRSCAAANALLDLGIGPGDCVALFAATCPEWIYFWLGAGRIGAVAAAVNAANKGDFLLHALRLSRAKVVVTDAERQSRVAELADQLPGLASIVVQDDSLDGNTRAPSTNTSATSGTSGRSSSPRARPGHRKPLPPHGTTCSPRPRRPRRPGNSARRGAVDGDAAVSSQRRAGGAGADAGRRDNGIGTGLSSRLGVGRGARLRRRRFRRRRRDGLDADESAAGSARRAAAAAIHLRGADRRRGVPRHRKALRMPDRHHVRPDRSLPDRGQRRGRRRGARNVGPAESQLRGANRRPGRRAAPGRLRGRDRLPPPLPARHERGLRERLGPGCRPAPGSGFAPGISVCWTATRTSLTWTG